MTVDPLTPRQEQALTFYIEAFCREQMHATTSDLAGRFEWSLCQSQRLTNELHAKGYVYVMGGKVAAIKRGVDGSRVRVMMTRAE